MPGDDSKVDVKAEVHSLLDAWCDRRAYLPICTLYGGYRALNGLTDGWEALLESLKRLRIMAREGDQITESEAERIGVLIGVISRALNSR